MPIDKYFKGSGDDVMSSMQKQYGDKKGKSVFYATAQKTGMKPGTAKNAEPIKSPKAPSAGKERKPESRKRGNIKR